MSLRAFSTTELTARVNAALRKRAAPESFALGELAIHYERRRVTLGGAPVRLTATEYELLRTLSLNAGRTSTYRSLVREVWRARDDADSELVRTVVKNLRRKLRDDASRPAYLFNERGIGYRMAAPGER